MKTITASKPGLALALVAAAFASSCGEGDLVHTEVVPQALGTYRSGLTMAAAGGCTSGIAQGLTNQLLEELDCVAPNIMVNFSGSHTTLYSATLPYLAPSAASALRNATTQANDSITIASAYRSLAQQYLLWKWWKAGQCNIQIAATPGSSNHQSGRAIDTPYYSSWRPRLEANGWDWYGSGDVVHFDFLSAPNVSAKSILAFQKLWNRNNSSKLAEDSQWGPATQNAMANSPTTGFPIHGCAATQTNGTFTGLIYQNGNSTDRLSGVTVTVGSKSVTTGTDGKYTFTLAPGSYTATASKAGYLTQSVTKAVTAGATTWGSMNLVASTTTGTLKGSISSASGGPLSGATVTAGNKTLTTDASGSFSFTLAAGSYSLSVTKQGFQPHSSTRTVTAGGTSTANVSLQPATVDGAPAVRIDAPLDNSSSEFAVVTVSGSVTDDGAALGSVSVRLNGAPASTADVNAGLFSFDLKLAPGSNLIEVKATDSAGNKGSASVHATFRAGLSGTVHAYDQPEQLIADAEVSIVDALTEALAGATRTDAAGAFALDVPAAPATYVLTIRKDGYVTHTESIAIGDETRSTLDVGLTPGRDGEFSIRFIEPAPGLVVETDSTTISGVVSGLQVSAVHVDGQDAQLLGTSAFVATVPVAEGHNVYQVVAESPEGFSVTATVEIDRPVTTATGKTCAVAPTSLAPLGLLALGLAQIRRRWRAA